MYLLDVSFRMHPARDVVVTDAELTSIVAERCDVGNAAAVGDMTLQCNFAAALDQLGARDAERFERGQPLFLAVEVFLAVATRSIDGYPRHAVPRRVGKCGIADVCSRRCHRRGAVRGR